MTTPKTARHQKPIVKVKAGETISGVVVAIASDSEGRCVMIEDAQRKAWVNMRKSDFKALMRSLGPTPLDRAVSVMVTMGQQERHALEDVVLADQVTAYVSGALTDGGEG